MFVSSNVSISIPILLSSVIDKTDTGGVSGFKGREARATESELESVKPAAFKALTLIR